jgi:hypothetical protein
MVVTRAAESREIPSEASVSSNPSKEVTSK